jgi:hypothetical protein
LTTGNENDERVEVRETARLGCCAWPEEANGFFL